MVRYRGAVAGAASLALALGTVTAITAASPTLAASTAAVTTTGAATGTGGRLHRRRAHPGPARLAALPGDRQRRLHQRAHLGQPGLRRGQQPFPARQPRHADRPGHPVPDQLQPGLRAPVGEQDGRPGHDGHLGPGERPARVVHLRPADLPRRSARAERPGPAGPPGLGAQPGRRAGPQPAPAGLHPRADLHQPGHQGIGERHPVPGQQAGHHPVRADQERRHVPGDRRLHRTARRAQRRGRHHRGLVPLG